MENFKGQDFVKLKKDCLKHRVLFEDPYFKPSDKSLYYSKRPPQGLKWLRPHEIVKRRRLGHPEFVEKTANADDLDQGFLGNCWFVAGCAAITFVPELFRQVVPIPQEFDENYAGIFHFRFWLYGRWTDVTIDDYLPVWENNRLAFCSNRQEPNEFWAALLEKAYAKVCGCYENLKGGFITDILVDLTGGIQESIKLTNKRSQKDKDYLWYILAKSRKHKSMNGCSIEPDPAVYEARLSNGLVKGHAYTVTNMASLTVNGRHLRLIRVRNPWGNEIEWKGAWSDSSKEFLTASDDLKRRLDFKKKNDGEFWMSFDDFYSNFDTVQFCHLTPDSFSEEILKSNHNKNISWNLVSYHGEWIPGQTAGGSGNGGDRRYWRNPQYLIRLVDVDLDDNENMASLIIALMQKNTRANRMQNAGKRAEDYIEFRLFKVKSNKVAESAITNSMKLLDDQLHRMGSSGSYVNRREVTHRFRIEPGYYVIIPSTFDADSSGQYLLRIFTEKMLGNSSLLSHSFVLRNAQNVVPKNRRLGNQNEVFRAWVPAFAASNEVAASSDFFEFDFPSIFGTNTAQANDPFDDIPKDDLPNFIENDNFDSMYRTNFRFFEEDNFLFDSDLF